MKIDTSKRSDAPEIMDDFNLKGEVLRDALDKIAAINRMLGGNKVTLQGLSELLKIKARLVTPRTGEIEEISILDVGCGNGDMLRMLSDYGKKKNLNFRLTGIDANGYTIQHAKQLSVNHPNISYRCADIFEEIKQPGTYDVILCTLTLHHFKNEEITTLMNGFKAQSNLGIVVNDLHRTKVAYYLFSAICYVFGLNQMSKDDGLVSILRGFKREDLRSFSRKLNLSTYSLKWKWAFRYQWIIPTV